MKIAIVVLLAVLAGCSTSPLGSIPMWKNPDAASMQGYREMSTPEAKAEFKVKQISDARDQYLVDLKASFDLVMVGAKATLDGLAAKAERYSAFDLSIGLSGILAGAGAAVLVAASPANAATVAGLTAWGSGATGYQTSLANAGFSREVIAKVHQNLQQKIGVKVGEYSVAYRKLLGVADESAWEVAAREAEAALYEIASLSMLVPMGEIPPKPSDS